MKQYSMVLLAAGIGKRMGIGKPKQMMQVGGKPMIIHCLMAVEKIEAISEVIITCPEDFKDELEKTIAIYNISKKMNFIIGGNSRQESVYKGLLEAKCENVIIHEAARPMIKQIDFEKLIEDADENVMYGLDIPFTVLFQKDGKVSGNIKRDEIVNVQLPHKYNTKKILTAHEKAIKDESLFTEDAGLAFTYGLDVKVIKGNPENIKLTNQVDVITVEAILENKHV